MHFPDCLFIRFDAVLIVRKQNNEIQSVYFEQKLPGLATSYTKEIVLFRHCFSYDPYLLIAIQIWPTFTEILSNRLPTVNLDSGKLMIELPYTDVEGLKKVHRIDFPIVSQTQISIFHLS